MASISSTWRAGSGGGVNSAVWVSSFAASRKASRFSLATSENIPSGNRRRYASNMTGSLLSWIDCQSASSMADGSARSTVVDGADGSSSVAVSIALK